MSLRRLFLLAFVALGLAPGLWLRTPAPRENTEHILRVTRLAIPARQWGRLRLIGAWRLASRNSRFGGYSALVALGDGRLLAASDRGYMLVFNPSGAGPVRYEMSRYARLDLRWWGLNDLESMTRDPVSGRLWTGYEQVNRILRVEADYSHPVFVSPPAMRGWQADFGPESMVRLADGRFIVLAERSPRWFDSTTPGLLFPRDPVSGAVPQRFKVRLPSGYSPTDIAQLPDGRVLLLLRGFRLGLPPRYPGLIAWADPAQIRPGATWAPTVLGRLEPPVPSDNYEGLAIVPEPGGGATVWAISDDNVSVFQRTLLLKLRWEPQTTKARGSPARL